MNRTFDINAMLKPGVYDHPVADIELIETHISWVVLTGKFAYKIKKPVNFGFLDFSTLEKRRICCEQELRLNRRLALEIYLDVVSVTGSAECLHISDKGKAVEYAVKMQQFPQSAQLDCMLAAGDLKVQHMDAIAAMVADFHQTVEIADKTMEFGNADLVYQPVAENFRQINQHIDAAVYAELLKKIALWSQQQAAKLQKTFSSRKKQGFVRECHGDMHLRNLMWLAGKPMAFDCIEFNAQLRWIDVISEIAFLVMDLHERQQARLANRFLNSYLESTGDYAGLLVFTFYLCYRAMVRAKVNALLLEQKENADDERKNLIAGFESYLELAASYIKQPKAKLIIMRGLSASGKSTVSQQLVDELGVIRIRSDVERKRLFDIVSHESASSCINSGIYSSRASQKTYEKLIELASGIISAGYSVIVDATFSAYEQRVPFKILADSLGVSYLIIETTAPVDVLRQRILQRQNDVSDADITVLEQQVLNWQDFHEDETGVKITVNTEELMVVQHLIDRIKEL